MHALGTLDTLCFHMRGPQAVMHAACRHSPFYPGQTFSLGPSRCDMYAAEGDAFLMAFHEPAAAVAWGLATQQVSPRSAIFLPNAMPNSCM